MSDISAISSASLGRLLSPAGQGAGATGVGGQQTQEQAAEAREERNTQAVTVGTEGGSTPTGGRGQFVDVFA